jgi:ribosomal protein L11 methyltransferase
LWSILFLPAPNARDTLIAELWERGTSGIIEEAGGLRAFFEDSIQPENVRCGFSISLTGFRREEESKSFHYCHEHCDPVLIGKRFFVTPPWYRGDVPEGRFHLTIENTSAFGTGRHESTQLALEALETYLAPWHTVLDVGCGSGILSAAASLLGARAVCSCDIHPDAIGAARRQIRTPVFAGSADAVRCRFADIVVANISAAVIDHIAFDLWRVAKPRGIIIIAGFISEKVPQRYSPEKITERAGWLCWICHPEGIDRSINDETDRNFHSERWWI